MADAQNDAPYFLFQNYIVEIVKYFHTITSHIIDDQEFFHQADGSEPLPNPNFNLPMKLYVTYGNPRAAFKRMIERFNGLTRLPYLNINGAGSIRRVEKEPVGVRYYMKEFVEPGDTTIPVFRPPMQFDVTYKLILLTSSQQERDHVLYQIYCMFPRNEISLIVKDPNGKGFVFVPLKIEYNTDDATNWESTENNDAREFIRTELTLQAQHTVPLPYKEIPLITNVQFDTITRGYPAGGILDYTDHTQYNLTQDTDGTVRVTIS